MSVINSLKSNKKRLLTGLIVASVVFFCVVKGGLPLLLLVLAFVYMGSKEYVEILKNKGFFPFFNVIITIAVVMLIIISLGANDFIPIILVTGVIISFLAVLFKGRQPYIANVATTILGFMFCWLPGYIILIRQINTSGYNLFDGYLNDGMNFLILLFFVILATDTGAYYFGTKYGKHKLATIISPKKSVEGSIAGAICALITSIAIGSAINIGVIHSAILGLLITIFAQLGDLSESLIKRDAGVKDSGNSLPGHGGFLDRVDSYLFSAPIAYYYLKYFVITNYSFNDFITSIKKVLDVIGF